VPKRDFQDIQPEYLPFFSCLIKEILEERIPPRKRRSNPMVVKKTTLKVSVQEANTRGYGSKTATAFLCHYQYCLIFKQEVL
jgi:hypothetical protein